MLVRLVLLAWGLGGIVSVQAQDWSAANHCATVCCSKAGFCGLGPEYCSPDVCVSGCDNKADCGPGGYGEYAEHSKFPINGCCSKRGYCGSTSEICNDTKVNRPSAEYNDFTPLRRVVGYYEGWSRKRACNKFYPEQIPLGIYTVRPFHLLLALLGLTFKIKLESTTEAGLIHRLARKKMYDADLKVYVTLGGWAYNDPGPTQTTFSHLARSEGAQKKFFRSLISFLSTYNLDGVDIDWKYPGPHDIVGRGGSKEDFDNFPIFLRRLKQALKTTGGRDGVTTTLPASSWFLQHFDLVQLEKHVDFFNFMSYDLHGAWDKGNKWRGPYLSAHTNLTRLAMPWTCYGGTSFRATSCLEPGCTFESAATMGNCSRENGILLNSEIVEILEAQGVKPTLDTKAGVKVATWDNQWVAYDDEETLELKSEFALSLGLGGVMVWAVSHDTQTARFSNAFVRRAANRNGLTSII
ncbi:glycoside hydrolase superfamily [Aspergillus granulosus]|uniref:chitinase n=1 Tax=Aspergillus granulosus TaxID=176169 RepID=A0ABR4GRN9_9EURO